MLSSEDTRIAYKILIEKLEWKRLFFRPRRRWEKNIKIDLKEYVWKEGDWIHLAPDRIQWWALVNTAMNIRFCEREQFLLLTERWLASQ
jgi:hypothetical protein